MRQEDGPRRRPSPGRRRPALRGGALALVLVAGAVSAAFWLLDPALEALPTDGAATDGSVDDRTIDDGVGGSAEGTAPGGGADGGAHDRAVVDRVIDGDTVDVVLGGETLRVRLLNIDTPETKKRDTPVQCLGPEASEYLTRLLPEGSAVTLAYDRERTDQYGRTLAAVFTADGENASVELAERGLGSSVLYEPNDRYHADVVGAEAFAARERVGMFDPGIACNALR